MQKLYISLSIIMLIFIFMSCGKQDTPYIMKVGNQSLSRDVLIDRFNSSPLKSQIDNLTIPELKNFIEEQFLETKLYVAEGYAMKLDQDSAIQKQFQKAEKDVLLKQNGLLFNAIVPKEFPTNDTEIQELYDHLDKEVKIAYILLQSKSLADSIYQLLQKGTDFAELARKYSLDTNTSSQGGVVNNYIRGGLPDAELEKTLYALEKNEFSAPINSMYGYQIIKVLDKRPCERPPLTEVQEEIVKRIENRKLNVFLKDYFDKLSQKYNFKINEAVISPILKAFEGKKDQSGLSQSDIDPSILNQTLAEYKIGTWTVAKFIEQYNSYSKSVKIPVKTVSDIEEFIKTAIRTDLMYAEATELNLKDKPEFAKELALTKERIVELKSKELLIAPKIEVTESEIAAYQEAHQKDYEKDSPDQARMLISNALRREKIQQVKQANINELKEKHKLVYDEAALENFLKEIKKKDVQ
ncbi:peptidylprolyl isomerase [candidate division KSB1 bacterium]|nr:peptidylprolyl isomerase [candidate division KSB1 bacterium]